MLTNHPKSRVFSAAAIVAAAAGAAQFASAQSFHLIGALPGTNTFSSGYGVSEDGSVVVGHSGNNYYYGSSSHAFKWSSDDGIIDLDPLAPAAGAYGISADGQTIVGGETSGSVHAVSWTPGTSSLTDQLYHGGECYGLSRDGNVAIGWSASGGGGGGGGGAFRPHRAIRYSASGSSHLEYIDTPAVGVVAPTNSESLATNTDGTVVVGWGVFSGVQRAFKWTAADGMTTITPGAGIANGVSGDGSVVVGDFVVGNTRHAFRWTAATGLVDLGALPDMLRSVAYAISNDGTTIVGMSQSGSFSGSQHAFIWRAGLGMQDLNVVLSAVKPAGYTLTEARAVNSNGTVFAGGSLTPTAGVEAWVVNAPLCISTSGIPSADSISAYSGSTINLAVAPGGFGPFVYQWRKNAEEIPGANSRQLQLAPAFMIDSGSYDCVITGACGTATSTPTALTVNCLGDINRDTQVDDSDFVLFASGYDLLVCSDAAMPATCPADFNGDGQVDDTDFVVFVGAYDALLCH